MKRIASFFIGMINIGAAHSEQFTFLSLPTAHNRSTLVETFFRMLLTPRTVLRDRA